MQSLTLPPIAIDWEVFTPLPLLVATPLPEFLINHSSTLIMIDNTNISNEAISIPESNYSVSLLGLVGLTIGLKIKDKIKQK